MLQKLLEKLGFGSSPTPFAKHVTECLEVLDILQEGLTQRAVSYVLEGTVESVLLDLRRVNAEEAIVLLDQPATLGWWHPSSNVRNDLQKHKKRINAAANARVRLYAVGADVDVPALGRFGKVLEAACQGGNLVRIAKVPDWYLYLVIDALVTTVKRVGEKYSKDMRQHWNLDLLERLLAVDELPTEDAPLLLLDRRDLNAYHWQDQEDQLLKLPGLAERLLEQPPLVRGLPERLSASGCINLVRLLSRNSTLATTYVDVLVRMAVNAAKGVRAEAMPRVEALPLVVKLEQLSQLLEHGSNGERIQAAEMLARSGDEARAILQARQTVEGAKPVQQALANALARLDSQATAEQQALPEAGEFECYPDVQLGDPVLQLLRKSLQELLEEKRLAAEEEIRSNREEKRKWDWRQKQYKEMQSVTDTDLQKALQCLNGEKTGKLNSAVNEVIGYKRHLANLPEMNLLHLIRAFNFNWYQLSSCFKGDALARLDLRTLEDAMQRAGHQRAAREVAEVCCGWNSPLEQMPPENVWPFFASHPEFLEEAFGLRPSESSNRYYGFNESWGLNILQRFPVLPARFIPILLELALGTSKTNRSEAQRLLETLADIGQRAEEALTSSKQEIRGMAADWLKRLGNPAAVQALNTALVKEKRETVRASLLAALEALGQDISGYLTPAVLLKEAQKGLQAKPPASLSWLDLDHLPAAQWLDGSPADPAIPRWWVILACKLKEPAGNALLSRYLQLLTPASRAALSKSLLLGFIAQDTRSPSLEEAIAYAQANHTQRIQQYKSWAQYGAEYANATPEQIFESLKREHLGIYLGSAIADKGILALAWALPGHELVSLLQSYMRDHYQRRAQIEAMLMAAANSDDPLVIQLLLSVARRHRTASVQAKARELIEQIAERNAWSADELADRTIPSAGFDEQGVLNLHYGERLFTARLDAALKLELRNPESKVVKALPEPRKSDDPALIKEAKSQLSTSKKEIKQVIDLQSQRLYEAMCAERLWPVAEWREYLFAHPLMNHLLQRLVWAEVDAEGGLRLFRPTEDGSLIDLDDDEIELAEGRHIRLTHAALVDGETAKGWSGHFKDYKIKPLFPQMSRELPELPATDATRESHEIEDHKGWMSDTFTLRGVLTKLGYQRAPAEDGGFFDHYFKDFASLKLRVCIGFTGNCLPEENVPAALTHLSYEKLGRRWSDGNLKLADISPVLLAETYADYRAVADACSGFDAQWEKKTPW
ncbi:hypothetical protein HNP46_006572 [Pseudomonas nitritireducens]|uniref:DUF4132 domain-containing protein n=1 Tax=Pseudomonas nitroreducens TaxID=46680 RepID=A0A7W7P438_PSENT|nr:DUF4132 domain-containing protein [Pseudomonas nitritireducens]MBB4867653.1 hypothetical protein [Pseudomonas nitritireducens]